MSAPPVLRRQACPSRPTARARAAARRAVPVRGPLRVGLLGGSFNPAHGGHLHVSRYALDRLGLDEVWWLVSPQNPLKGRAGMASLHKRLSAARALAASPRIRVSVLEGILGTRYTLDTVRALRAAFPRVRFVWIMGADNMVQIPAWKDWREIFRTVPVAVFDRASYSQEALRGEAARLFGPWRVGEKRGHVLGWTKPPAWAFFRTPLDPTSATAIRAVQAEWADGTGGRAGPDRPAPAAVRKGRERTFKRV